MILETNRVHLPKTVCQLADRLVWMAACAPEYRDLHLIARGAEREFAILRAAIAEVKGISQTIRAYLLARTDENWERLNAGEIGALKLSFGEMSHFMRDRRYREPRDLIIDRSNATPLDL